MSDTADDGLALPIDYQARYGDGHRRTAVLGGGGIFFVAWQLSHLRTLQRQGIDLASATRIVGTSAGRWWPRCSQAAAGAGREGDRAAGKGPQRVGRHGSRGRAKPSQDRALDLFRDGTDAEPETIRAIGYAALAAEALPAAKLRRNLRGSWQCAAGHRQPW